MTATQAKIHALDAAYKPFPTFKEWAEHIVVDSTRFDRYKAGLEARAKDLSPEILARVRNIATRAAAIDTGAIEGLYDVDQGFTFTVALEAAAWETLIAAKGENVRPLFEAQLHAYDFVLSLATKAEPISEAALRVLHEEVCKAQPTYRVVTAVGFQEQPLPKGQYKVLPNHVRTRKGTDHSYAPVDVTPIEMARLVGELRSEAFINSHPIMQAAYAHYALVVVHPFADGNGRVARALASAFTYRALSIPIVILSEHKNQYLDALENADSGNYQSFFDFMLVRCLDTINLVDESIRSALIPTAEQSSTALKKLYITKGGYSQDAIDKAGITLLADIQKAIDKEFSKYANEKLTKQFSDNSANYQLPAGYRLPIVGSRTLQIVFASAPPAWAQAARLYNLLLPKDAAGDDDILLREQRTSDTFRARLDELLPSTSGMFQIHLTMFVERVVNEMLAELLAKASDQIGR